LSRRRTAAKAYAFNVKPAFTWSAIAALVGAGAVLAVTDSAKEDRPQPAGKAAVKEETAAFDARLHRAPLPRQIGGQPFAALDWAPAARRVAPLPAAEAPLPQFPFRFAGRVEESGGAVSLYLARGSDIFPIRVGDLLEGFRIEALLEDRIDVTFVAGGQQVSVPLSTVADGQDSAVGASPAPRAALAVAPAAASGPVPVWPPRAAGGRPRTD